MCVNIVNYLVSLDELERIDTLQLDVGRKAKYAGCGDRSNSKLDNVAKREVVG